MAQGRVPSPTLKKCPDNRLKHFANTTQNFFDNQDFQKLEKI